VVAVVEFLLWIVVTLKELSAPHRRLWVFGVFVGLLITVVFFLLK